MQLPEHVFTGMWAESHLSELLRQMTGLDPQPEGETQRRDMLWTAGQCRVMVQKAKQGSNRGSQRSRNKSSGQSVIQNP